MARKPRIEYEGAFYHVITRGNQRQRVFKNRDDYERYLKILGNYKIQYDYVLYAYVLMSNHVHLLIETREKPLSKGERTPGSDLQIDLGAETTVPGLEA